MFAQLTLGNFIAHAAAQAPTIAQPQIAQSLTVANIAQSLQSAGYQALISDQPAPPGVLGTIVSGVGGSRVLILVNRCENTKDDSVCNLFFLTSFLDNKNLINDSTVNLLNTKALMSKVAVQTKDAVPTGFRLSYIYPCLGLPDAKFAAMVLASFGSDVARVLNAYQGLSTGNSLAPAKP